MNEEKKHDERRRGGTEASRPNVYIKHAKFDNKIVILGFGSIGQGVLPLILRHIDTDRKNISILTGDERGKHIADKEGIALCVEPLGPDNYKEVLGRFLKTGDFLVNLSVDVSSVHLIEYCHANGILYVDTSLEPWADKHLSPNLTLEERSNYHSREGILALKKKFPDGPTAITAHGANPGIISHFLKQALINIARDTGFETEKPKTRQEWAILARDLGIKTIHIAEYDSQVANQPKKIGRFENTWSVDGFHYEGLLQPSELGWGVHEKYFPSDAARHEFGCRAAVYIKLPGVRIKVKTWTPSRNQFVGRLVTHNESISIADFFSIKDGEKVLYRPTVHYAYRPCDAAMLSLEEAMGDNSKLQSEQKILLDELISGMDELGVLVMGHAKNAYWYGSQLTIDEARNLAPYQNATGLQVTAGVLGAVIWAMENPNVGVTEANELDYERLMGIITPYMGRMYGEYTEWTPLKYRNAIFKEDLDETDPWQFKNFRIS